MSDWRDGRLVLRRSEARNSSVAKCYIEQTPEEATVLNDGFVESVTRRRDMTEQERGEELGKLTALVDQTAR